MCFSNATFLRVKVSTVEDKELRGGAEAEKAFRFSFILSRDKRPFRLRELAREVGRLRGRLAALARRQGGNMCQTNGGFSDGNMQKTGGFELRA